MSSVDQPQIRNFCIIAHVDHGKSTLADRFLEMGDLKPRVSVEQVLDTNPIERERGITIKLAPVRLKYKLSEKLQEIFNFARLPARQAFCTFNLIDTPGHVDFSYEVSRALAACEGAILLVDATRGVQAQTLAHARVALSLGLTIIPVVNKIDLPNADVEGTKRQLAEFFGFEAEVILSVSAKTGMGVGKLLEEVAMRIPAPSGKTGQASRALVFNSVYDPHRGVVAWVRVVDGQIKVGDNLGFLATGARGVAEEVGFFELEHRPARALSAGEVGYVVSGLKDISLVKVGDTLTLAGEKPISLPGYQLPKPMVFLSLYPVINQNFLQLRSALEKLALSDSSLSFGPEASPVLGQGFRCGFLGLLHAEITQERLGREFGVETFAATPSVPYELEPKDGSVKVITAAGDFPEAGMVRVIREPVMKVTTISPKEFLGAVMGLAEEKRGRLVDMTYIGDQVKIIHEVPLAELIAGFADQLKSRSKGYASMDYEFLKMEPVDLVKLDVVIAGDKIESLSQLVIRERALYIARKMAERFKEIIPRHNFEIAIQIMIGGKILARADVGAFRKDVIAKLSGGDQTRKTKLLERQKKGKARMKQFGRVSLPQEVFVDFLKS